MVSIVNGYFCATGCDERLAKKDIDPRNPHDDPVKQEQLDAKDPQKILQKEIEEARDAGLEAKPGRSEGGGGEDGRPQPQPGTGVLLDVYA